MRISLPALPLFIAALSSCMSVAALTPSPYTFDGPSHLVEAVSRSVELGGAITRVSTQYTLSSGNAADNRFIFSLDAAVGVAAGNDGQGPGQLSWIEATTGKTSNSKRPVHVHALGYDAARSAYFYAAQLSLAQEGAAAAASTVTVHAVYNHASIAKPATVPQDAVSQGMYWRGDLLGGAAAALVDPLQPGKVQVKVKTPSPRSAEELVPAGWSASHPNGASVITFTTTEPLSASSSSSSSSSSASSGSVASVYYEQPEPVISVRKLDRTAQVSHWGHSLAIQDDIVLVNDGPKLKGHFSRLTHQAISYMRRSGNAVSPHTLTAMAFILPPNVHSPYFIDEIGNVSTSRFRPSAPQPKHTTELAKPKRPVGHSVLEITPRYPLLGGWNYTFTVGYTWPLQDILRHDVHKERYVLAVPFLTPLKNVAFDDVTLKIVLPEGASNIVLSPPFPVDESSNQTTYTYLDTTGRPTLVLHKTACAEKHGLEVLVSYDYSTAKLLRKPFVIGTSLAGAFFLAGLMRRINWSLKV